MTSRVEELSEERGTRRGVRDEKSQQRDVDRENGDQQTIPEADTHHKSPQIEQNTHKNFDSDSLLIEDSKGSDH